MNLAPRIVAALPPRLLARASALRRRSRLLDRLSAPMVSALRNRDLRIRTGIAKGLLLNTGEHNLNYLLPFAEPDVAAALTALLEPGATFYDVGANVGFYSIAAARIVGRDGAVAAFEPMARNRELLEHNVRANRFRNVRCLPYALGDCDGDAAFLVSRSHSWGMLARAGRVPMNFVGEETVAVRALDGVVLGENLPAPALIKMDVEGGEAAALHGACEVLRRYRPILLIELHDTAAEVVAELDACGYQASRLGSARTIETARGNLHIVAAARGDRRRDAIFALVRDASFPRCDRCTAA